MMSLCSGLRSGYDGYTAVSLRTVKRRPSGIIAVRLIAAFACPFSAVEIASHAATAWHSATFSGMRCILIPITNNGADIFIFEQKIMETDRPIPDAFVPDFTVGACRTDDAHCPNVDVRTIDA